MSNQKLTNLTYLNEASAGNPFFIKEMIEIFLKQTPDYVQQLKSAAVSNEWTEFRRLIHKLKPTITMMGIKEGEVLVKDIEHIVKNNLELEKVQVILQELIQICESAYLELNDELKRLS